MNTPHTHPHSHTSPHLHTHLRRHRDIQMTEGPLFGKILLFRLPLIVTNLLQTFYNAADMMVVSLSSEENAVGAIGTTGSMINLVLNIFIGLSAGANVAVAHKIGEQDDDGTSRTVHTALLMSVLLGLAGTVAGLAIARPVLYAMGAQGALLDLAVLYTRIYILGAPFLSVTNFAISIFRAKGDTRTPLVILTLTGLLNVGLNLFFVLAARLSVDGVAIATLISNFTSAVLLLFFLSRDEGPCRFSFRRLRFSGAAARDIIYIGVPASVQGALFSLSNIIIQSSILQVNNASVPPGTTYQPVVNGNAAAANLEGFIYTATTSVHLAAIAFTGQNVGAKKYDRVKRVMLSCYLLTFCVAMIVSGVIVLLREPLLGLYGVTNDPDDPLRALAFHTAWIHILYMEIPYFLLAFMEIGSGVLRGMGKSVTAMIVSLVGICALRLVWIWTVFRALGTLESIYISYPISWAVTAAVHFLFCALTLRKFRKDRDPT